jgi:hypothetical protein
MTKQEILNHDGWRYISSLGPKERHFALFGTNKSIIEKVFDVSIEEKPFTDLNKIDERCVMLSVTDSFRGISFIAVLTPNHIKAETKA